ncbi:hypothetical protein [Shewanella sp. Isolate7]|uniref:hypothetical protein n=1 Tax=Shewanella sp. Isolate7 TaxID=2908528 RepID=UPI001EFEA75C|nr:hypothetical protein [Shewanella sp. Isolate7]MCG9722144.1 hypothetical protein [Shewanella sp. Isolate7]
MKIENANHIHAALRAQGLTSRSWAVSKGFNPRTVQDCIQTFAPCEQRKPKRTLSKRIIDELSKTIGYDLLEVNHD